MQYIVVLKSCGNIDHNENPYEEVAPSGFGYADTIEGCVEKVENYIEDYCLGSGQWCGGQVYEADDGYVGRISYNGRFWSKDTEYGKE